MQRESLKFYETRQESRQGGKIRARTGSEKNATASVECQREDDQWTFLQDSQAKVYIRIW